MSFTAPAAGEVTLSSSISTSTSQGPNTLPDSASAATAISPLADVTTSISVPPSAVAGATVNGSVTYSNHGPSSAAGLVFTLGLPPGLANVVLSGVPAGATATYDPATGAVNFTAMPSGLGAGSSIVLGVSYTAPPSGSVTVESSISTTTSQGANPRPDSASATTAISPLADVTTSIALPPSAVAGSTVNGSVTYSNQGPSSADGLGFALGLPPGLSNVLISGLPAGVTATYDAATGAVNFAGTPASAGAGSGIVLGLSFTAPPAGSVVVDSSIATTTSQGPNALPDSASAITAISPLADVTTNIALSPSAVAGSTVNASVTYSNHGPSSAAGLVFTLGLPPGLANVIVSGLPAGVTAAYDPATGAVIFSGTPASVGAGASITVGVSFTAPAAGAVTLSSSLSTTTSQGPNTFPDTASATVAISPLADVTTSVSAPPTAIAGSTVNGSVTYSNHGPSAAAGLGFALALPPGLANVVISGVPAGVTATYDAATGGVNFTGTPASAGAGASITLGVSYTAPAAGAVTLASSVSTTTSQGPNTLPDTATATTAISPLADVTTTVTMPPSAVAGSTVNASVSYSNAGPSVATGMTYTLNLGPGLAGVVFSGLPGGALANYNAATGVVTLSGMPVTLGAGATLALGVSFTAPASGAVTVSSSLGTATSQGANPLPIRRARRPRSRRWPT